MFTRASLLRGFSFGLTSGVITTLGMMVGLHSGTHLKSAVLGGIFAIAVADAFSDALGTHVSEEAENEHTTSHIWGATICTWIAKFFTALTFAIPVLLLPLTPAIIVGVAWGLLLIAGFSFYMAKQLGEAPHKAVLEHFAIAGVVVVLTHYIGDWIGTWSG